MEQWHFRLGNVSSGWDGKDVFESLEANDGTRFLLQENAEDLEYLLLFLFQVTALYWISQAKIPSKLMLRKKNICN